MALNNLLCKHDWEKLHERTSKSAFEQALQAGELEEFDAKPWAFRTVHTAILTCRKCGKVKQFTMVSH